MLGPGHPVKLVSVGRWGIQVRPAGSCEGAVAGDGTALGTG